MAGAGTVDVRRLQRIGGGTPGGNIITFTGRHAERSGAARRLPGSDLRDRARPVGSYDRDDAFTWTSETPAIASIDQNGVFTALAAGTATFRATTADG